jgi:hypothetical protein
MIFLDIGKILKILPAMVILVIIILVLKWVGEIYSGGVRQSFEKVSVFLRSMEEQEKLHIARIVVSDFHIYPLDSNGKIVNDDKKSETASYIAVSTVDAFLRVSDIKVEAKNSQIVVSLPRIEVDEAKIYEKLSLIWDKSNEFKGIDLEANLATAARNRAAMIARKSDIRQQAKENANSFFSVLIKMLGKDDVRVVFSDEDSRL